MTSEIDQELLRSWKVHLGAVQSVGELAHAFADRWCSNAVADPPKGLPPITGLAELHGWGVALEAYLCHFDAPGAETDLLARAIICAAQDYEGPPEDAWLADIMALRRLPVAALDGADDDAAHRFAVPLGHFLLEEIAKISRELPGIDTDVYALFRRRYDSLATVLVSEVIEGPASNLLALGHMAGSRYLDPFTRTVFKPIAAAGRDQTLMGDSAERLASVRRDWAKQIGELVDSIVLLNGDLADVGKRLIGYVGLKHARRKLEDHVNAWAREFDRPFQLLLAADDGKRSDYKRDTGIHLKKALDDLHRFNSERTLGDFWPSIDVLATQQILWDGLQPVKEVGYDPDGVVSISAELEARLQDRKSVV